MLSRTRADLRNKAQMKFLEPAGANSTCLVQAGFHLGQRAPWVAFGQGPPEMNSGPDLPKGQRPVHRESQQLGSRGIDAGDVARPDAREGDAKAECYSDRVVMTDLSSPAQGLFSAVARACSGNPRCHRSQAL